MGTLVNKEHGNNEKVKDRLALRSKELSAELLITESTLKLHRQKIPEYV